jgi:hypothetical protein
MCEFKKVNKLFKRFTITVDDKNTSHMFVNNSV